MTNQINKAIGNDLTNKMKANKISDYYIYSKLKLCSQPTLMKIKKGNDSNNTPFNLITAIYKAIGFNELIIDENGIKLKVNF